MFHGSSVEGDLATNIEGIVHTASLQVVGGRVVGQPHPPPANKASTLCVNSREKYTVIHACTSLRGTTCAHKNNNSNLIKIYLKTKQYLIHLINSHHYSYMYVATCMNTQ